jgi:hypothetical protein
MVGRVEQVNRFSVSPIYLTCDNTVNTIPVGSPERLALHALAARTRWSALFVNFACG